MVTDRHLLCYIAVIGEDLFITAAKALRGKEEAADVVQDIFLSFWKLDERIVVQLYGTYKSSCQPVPRKGWIVYFKIHPFQGIWNTYQ
jgi:hypothetical protein